VLSGLLGAVALLGGCATSGPRAWVPPAIVDQRSASTVSKLDNGMRIIVRPQPGTAVVALQLWIDVGSADESDALAGAAHALEHMVFKGTERRGVGDIAREIESVGGDVNAWTSLDHTVFHVTMPARDWQRGLAVLADAVLNVKLDDEELRKEIEVILEEIKESDDSPASVAAHELFALAFERHPYRRPVIGWAATVRRFRRAALDRFLRRYYAPERMALVVVGEVDAARVQAHVARSFAAARPVAGSRRAQRGGRAAEPSQQQLRVRVVQRPCREAQLALGFRIPELTAADSPALDLAAVILGQGEGSWLVRRVKDEQQVVTDIAAYAYAPRDPGLLIVNAASRPERVVEAAAAIGEQLRLLAQTGPTRAELERARALIEGDTVHQQETVQGQARQLGYFASVAGDPEFDRRYLERVQRIDAAQVMAAARRYLTAERLSLVALTSYADPRLEPDLRQAVLAAFRGPPAARAPVARAAVPTRWRLPGGARLVLLPDPSLPIVVMRAAWLGGLRYETAASNGINNLLAALATRGTTSRSADEVNGAIERMAGSIAGFSGRNSFGLRLDVLARYQHEALDVLADCICNPAFRPSEVVGRRREALDELEALADDPVTSALDLFAATAYRRHPYRLNPLGTPRSVAGLRREQLAAYHRRYFTPDRMVFVATGDLDVDGLRARCARLFGAAAGRRVVARPPAPAPEPALRAPRWAELTLPKEQAQVVVGYPGTTLRHRDRHALELLAALLAGQGGRLFLDLRDGQGLAYRLGAFSQEGIEPGQFVIHVATAPDKVQAVLEGIAAHLAALRDDRVGAHELRRVQRYAIGTHQIALQRKATLASCMAFDELYGLGYAAYRRYADEVSAVTAEQLRAVARRYLVEQRRVVAIVRPEGA